MDDATHMRFSMTLKSKNAICKELVTIFNQVKTYTRQDLEYFSSDNIEKYQELQPTFQKEGILWEKFTSYAQHLNSISERSI